MTIAASVVLEDMPQADGRRWIRERHTDQLGGHHYVAYKAAAGYDASGTLSQRAAMVDAMMAAAELNANEGEV